MPSLKSAASSVQSFGISAPCLSRRAEMIGPGPQPLSRMPVAWEKGRAALVRSSKVLMAFVEGPEERVLYSAAREDQSSPLAVERMLN